MEKREEEKEEEEEEVVNIMYYTACPKVFISLLVCLLSIILSITLPLLIVHFLTCQKIVRL